MSNIKEGIPRKSTLIPQKQRAIPRKFTSFPQKFVEIPQTGKNQGFFPILNLKLRVSELNQEIQPFSWAYYH
ncbi:hypothetical protein V7201_07895 [Bacillus sp. JJ1122]